MAAPLSRVEFVSLVAMMTATIAFSIDAMLPALPDIGQDLNAAASNNVQLVITTFLFGLGLGTIFSGPLSDRFGRKRIILIGAGLYILGSLVAAVSQSLTVLLIARVVQGIGGSGPRVASIALIRDVYSGREMARTLSFVMMLFTLVPAFAPSLGAALVTLGGWRAIFVAFIVFAAIYVTWMLLRLPETLTEQDRRPLSLSNIAQGVVEMFRHPVARLSIYVQALGLAIIFALLSTTQQIFDVSFDRAESFPLWFGLIALLAGSASFVNAALVVRLGMRFIVNAVLIFQISVTGLVLLSLLFDLSDTLRFAIFIAWHTVIFFQAGLMMGNMNAIAMEPMGHMAGLAASVMGSVSTVAGVIIAIPVGLMFDGTPLPLAVGALVFGLAALGLMRRLHKLEPTAARNS